MHTPGRQGQLSCHTSLVFRFEQPGNARQGVDGRGRRRAHEKLLPHTARVDGARRRSVGARKPGAGSGGVERRQGGTSRQPGSLPERPHGLRDFVGLFHAHERLGFQHFEHGSVWPQVQHLHAPPLPVSARRKRPSYSTALAALADTDSSGLRAGSSRSHRAHSL